MKQSENENIDVFEEEQSIKSKCVLPQSRKKRSIDRHQEFNNKVEKRQRIPTSEGDISRGKRLFGSLLGTLQQIDRDSSKENDSLLRRQEIETRLEKKLQQEHKEFQSEVAEKRRLSKIESERRMADFLKTKTKPCVYFKPTFLISALAEQIELQKKLLDCIDKPTEESCLS